MVAPQNVMAAGQHRPVLLLWPPPPLLLPLLLLLLLRAPCWPGAVVDSKAMPVLCRGSNDAGVLREDVARETATCLCLTWREELTAATAPPRCCCAYRRAARRTRALLRLPQAAARVWAQQHDAFANACWRSRRADAGGAAGPRPSGARTQRPLAPALDTPNASTVRKLRAVELTPCVQQRGAKRSCVRARLHADLRCAVRNTSLVLPRASIALWRQHWWKS